MSKDGTSADTKKGLPTYDEPTKKAVRTRALAHAVELLTTRRENAAIVPSDHVGRVRDQLQSSDIAGYRQAAEACRTADFASWRAFRASSIGTRKAEELTVAYLAGPQPSNDLKALTDLRLRPENIFAFEIDARAISSGLHDLEELGLRGIKFIPASIDRYLVGTPRRFDIIYIDACGALPSHEQRTQRLLVDIFRHGALAPLGVLVTNFCRPDISTEKDLQNYAFLAAAYLFPKTFVEDGEGSMVEGPPCYGYEFQKNGQPGDSFLTKVREDFEQHYGAFITRHIMDIASIIAPMARLTSSKLHEVLFDVDIAKAAQRGRRFARFDPAFLEDGATDQQGDAVDVREMDGDAITEPGMFSLIWTLAACGLYEVDINFDKPPADVQKFATRWVNQLNGSLPGAPPAQDLIAAFYAWRADQSLWSSAMKQIGEFPYRDLMPFLCDVPTEEIGFYPAFAQLAYPAHANIREAKRFRYVAEGKATPMFMDVLVFDECRYVYDWLSAIHLLPEDWFDLSAQLTFRFALNGIVKDRRWFGDDFLFGCHVVGTNEEGFDASELPGRIDLSPNMGS